MAELATIETQLQEFSESVHKDKQKYINFALRFVRDKTVVEDIINDSFISFWESRANITDSGLVRTYFYTIIKNHCLNWLRNKEAQTRIQQQIHDVSYRLLQYDIVSLESYDPNLIFTSEIEEILQSQLEKMPELTRRIFIESRFNDMSYDDIAEKYNVSIWKVSREIQYALGILRISLRDYLPVLAMLGYICSELKK